MQADKPDKMDGPSYEVCDVKDGHWEAVSFDLHMVDQVSLNMLSHVTGMQLSARMEHQDTYTMKQLTNFRFSTRETSLPCSPMRHAK